MIVRNYGRGSPVLVGAFGLASVAHRSYVIVDSASRTAAVVDPIPDPGPTLELVAREGALLRHIFLTKQHGDFECGHRELANRTGAVVYTGAWARPDFPHLPVKDGDELHFGATALRILETPGHTLEGISILAGDPVHDAAPWGLFAGDLLYDGDVARPEPRLDDGFTVSGLADMLYASLFRKLLALPPEIRVFSGHGGGDVDPPPLADLRRSIPLLRPMSRSAFRSLATAGMLPSPALRDTRNVLNRSASGASMHRSPDPVARFPLDLFLSRIDRGAIPIDLREPREFAAAHLRGSLSLGLGADFADWAPALLDPTEEYVILANPGSEPEAALRLAPIIGPRLLGALEGGMITLESRPDLLERTLRRPRARAQVDVRPIHDGDSARSARPARSRRLPLEELLGRLDEMPRRRTSLGIVDGDPYRAHAAASLLRRRGWPGARPLPTRSPA